MKLQNIDKFLISTENDENPCINLKNIESVHRISRQIKFVMLSGNKYEWNYKTVINSELEYARISKSLGTVLVPKTS